MSSHNACMSAGRHVLPELQLDVVLPPITTMNAVSVSDFMAQLPSTERVALLALGQPKVFSRDEYLFRAGSPARSVFLITRGRVKVFQASPTGKEAILWFCFDGDLFGLAETLSGSNRVASAQACDETSILSFAYDQFARFLAGHPATSNTIMRLLACRLRMLSEHVINLVSDDVRTRIHKLLLQLGARYGRISETGIKLPFSPTHQELADMIGATRQTVTSILGQLEQEGILTIERRQICIIDRNAYRTG